MANTRERYCVEDLRKERASCNFNQEELTNLIDGGKEFTDFRRKINASFLNDPAYDDEIPPDYLSHEDRYSNELRKACHTFLKLRNENYTMEEFQSYGPTMLLKDGNPLALHMGMFYDALKGQCTEEQQQRWLGRVKRGEIIGTYAQTELGHGTFVRGLETTATYDLRTQEFVLHSPTITSTKWWPGCLGKTSSYAVVMAQLYSKGKCYGPHPFFVQLRDEKTHRSMPGVTLGEIGPRAGLNTNDNGFLRFNNYRIPRTNMLMKHSQVLKDGTYVKPGHAKLAYGTMVVTRVSLIFHSYKQLQRAVTIATRYSAVRRQSEMVPGYV
ncbi:Acyl-coenzyme A oxidase (Acyl-CoA oxidase) [Halocaridina rubra]|uniref:Acyl-coenzyme A oxidase (Acyl-CoA oxidase) n=1 Tax=Halocaridina rubra TaxID=373956 RepID=A0AAN9AHF8_HALRR